MRKPLNYGAGIIFALICLIPCRENDWVLFVILAVLGFLIGLHV